MLHGMVCWHQDVAHTCRLCKLSANSEVVQKTFPRLSSLTYAYLGKKGDVAILHLCFASAAQYNTGLLINLTPKGMIFSFLLPLQLPTDRGLQQQLLRNLPRELSSTPKMTTAWHGHAGLALKGASWQRKCQHRKVHFHAFTNFALFNTCTWYYQVVQSSSTIKQYHQIVLSSSTVK